MPAPCSGKGNVTKFINLYLRYNFHSLGKDWINSFFSSLNQIMKKYELLLVLPGTLDEKEAEVKSAEIWNLVKIGDAEAKMITLGKNRLAYPVKQIRYGYFYTIIFNMGAEDLKVLQDKLSLMRDLLRAIVSVYNPKWTETQKISYVTNNVGVTTMARGEEVSKMSETSAPAAVAVPEETKKIDLKDIDKKLDEILGGSIISGV